MSFLQNVLGGMMDHAGEATSALTVDAQKDMNDPANLVQMQQDMLAFEQQFKSISAVVSGIGSVSKSIIDRIQ